MAIQAPDELRRRRYGKNPSIVGALGTELRQEVEDMILSRQYTYGEIGKHLREAHNVHVSTSSLNRYAMNLKAER